MPKTTTPADAPPFNRVVVVAVGVETYQNPPGCDPIQPVAHATADAETFVEVLKTIYDGKAEVQSVLLINEKASLTTLRSTLKRVIRRLCPYDLFVFYYAGHGFQGGGENRLTAWDSSPDDLGATSLGLTEDLIGPLNASEIRRSLLFVDACAETLRQPASRGMLQSLSEAEIERALDEDDFMGVYLSCSPGERSYGDGRLGHGVFTSHLLQALRGEAEAALDDGRWLTDTGLRDWLRTAIRQWVTKHIQGGGEQTPRAILNAPSSFRIRHVETVSAGQVITLADLRLKNRDVFLEAVKTGPIRSLDGFSKASGHTVPATHSDRVKVWVDRLMQADLTAELDALRKAARENLEIPRADTQVEWADGGGTLDTPYFRYTILCDQDPDTASDYRVRRQLILRDGWQAARDGIGTVFAHVRLPTLVVEINVRDADFDTLADQLDALRRRTGGDVDEDTAHQRLTYRGRGITLVVDLENRRVELSDAAVSNLALVEAARGFDLGWNSHSPMLAAPMQAPAPPKVSVPIRVRAPKGSPPPPARKRKK